MENSSRFFHTHLKFTAGTSPSRPPAPSRAAKSILNLNYSEFIYEDDPSLDSFSVADNTTVNVDVRAGTSQHWIIVGAQSYFLTNWCFSPVPEKRDRTDIGVGEEVYLKLRNSRGDPPPVKSTPSWTTTGGWLSIPHTFPVIKLTAPNRENKVTVTAHVGGQKLSRDFAVIEPSG